MNEILHAEASAEMLKLDQNCKKTPSVAVLKKIFKSLLKTNVSSLIKYIFTMIYSIQLIIYW